MILLKRQYFDDATIGILYNPEILNPILFTIEKPWRDNKQNMSCIPEGQYQVVPKFSQKHGHCWEVTHVKDRSAILIHKANWESDLQGCIAPGISLGYLPKGGRPEKAVLHSAKGMECLRELVNDEGQVAPFILRIFS